MHPSDRLIAITGVFLVFAAAWLIVGSANIGLVTRGSIQVSDDASNSFSAEMNSPSSLSFSEVKLPSDVEGMTPPRLNVILSDDQMNVGGGNPQNENFDISNRFIGSANFFRKKEGKIEPVIEFVPNSFIVEFDSTIAVENQRAQSSALNVTLSQIADYSIRKLAPTHQNDAVSRFAVVNFKGDAQDTRLLQKRIEAVSGVSSVSPNYIAKTTQAGVGNTAPLGSGTPPATRTVVTPNDPYFSQQYMHDKIDSLAAWTQTKGSGSVVAVIDTGVDYQHPDLSANIWKNGGEIPNNGIDDEGNGYVDDVIGYDFVDTVPVPSIPQEDYLNEDNDPSDYGGHGTHVAGIIAAVTNNQKGVAGVCPECKIMSLRAGYAPGYLEVADIIQAIIYAADNGADVINMSFNGTDDIFAEKVALDYAYSKGVILVASAGNNGSDTIGYPGGYENVIGVTATDNLDHLAIFSSYGNWTDVAAPGVDILSTVPTNGYWLSQYYPPLSNDSYYANFSGTSMAAPVVAGVAGLAYSISSGASVDAIRSVIVSGVENFGTDIQQIPGDYIGNGRVHVPTLLGQLQLDSTAVLLIDDSIFENVVFGNAHLSGTAKSNQFGKTEFEIMRWYDSPVYAGYTAVLNSQVSNGALATIMSESLPEERDMIRATLRDSSGKILRVVRKTVQIKNFDVTEPSPNIVINPQNGDVSFYGSIAGDNMIQYTFGFGTDPYQPLSTQGFTYPDNTTKKTNELLATWTPPAGLPDSSVVTFRIATKFSNVTKESGDILYWIDRTVAKGWPVTIKLTNEKVSTGFFHFAPWKTSSGASTSRVFIYETEIEDQWPLAQTVIHLYSSVGTEMSGWPYSIPVQLTQGQITYNSAGASEASTFADVDDDGKDELLVHVTYVNFQTNFNGEDLFQSAIFAFNEDATLVNGFPIITHHPISSGGTLIMSDPVSAVDLDIDGVAELIVMTQERVNSTEIKSVIGVARKDSQGHYAFSTLMSQVPSSEVASLESKRTALTFQNVDADADLEIIGISAPHGEFDPSGSGQFSMIFHVYALNENGTSVAGWPIAIGDIYNYSYFTKSYGISSGWMDNQSVFGIVAKHNAWTTYPYVTSSFEFYLLDSAGNIPPGWPKNIPFSEFTDIQTPLFSDVDGDASSEVLFSETSKIHAYDKTGVEKRTWDFSLAYPHAILDRSMGVITQGGQPAILVNRFTPFINLHLGNATTGSQTVELPASQAVPDWVRNVLFLPGEPSLSSNSSGKRIGLATALFNYWDDPIYSIFQLFQWDVPQNWSEGDWSMFMRDKGRTNSGVDSSVTCQDLSSMTITSSISICPGTYSLQNGITIRADNTIPIIVTCNGTQFLGYNTPGSVGITIDSTLNQQGTVELRGCRVDEYSSAVKVSKYVNLTLEDNQFSNTVSISPSGVPLLSNPSVAGTISNNTFTNNASLSISYFGNLSILDNTFSVNGQGIGISNSDNVSVAGNHITHANTSSVNGITVLSSTNGTIFNNTIDGPFQYSVYTNVPSGGNYVVSENNFYIGARDQSFSPGSVTWYNAASQRGNYWSVHTCTDTQAPIGICDNAYAIYSPPQNPDPKDLYPLANPV